MHDRVLSGPIQWHVTSDCPYRCLHCYTYGKSSQEIVSEDLSYDELIAIYRNICEFEKKHQVRFTSFNLTGGDPLSLEKIWDLLKLLQTDGRRIGILGIPERITQKNIQKMKELGVNYYQVSLDGTQKSHDVIRGKGSFERTIKAIQLLCEEGIGCHVMYTIHNMNIDQLFPVIDYLESLELPFGFSFDFMIGATEEKEAFAPRMLTKDEAVKVLQRYHERQKLNIRRGTLLQLQDKSMLSGVMTAIDKGYLEGEYILGGCGVGESISILANGDVYPCRRLPIKVGNLNQEKMEDIFLNHEIMKSARRRQNWEYCRDCRFYHICRGCPAVSYAFTGNMFEQMEYCFLKQEEVHWQHEITENADEIEMTESSRESQKMKNESMMSLWEMVKRQGNYKMSMILSTKGSEKGSKHNISTDTGREGGVADGEQSSGS